ncbi:uncharacterized protein C5orf52 homolog [Anomaloglossus baeobatrachus]|uniref:uncharacterized protein C5orf52 homolog n=1 Tax=Anomaloglossus baeobatrachus TaxID=238106 RepID=UPI003F4FBF4F
MSSKEESTDSIVTFCTRKCTEGPMLYSLITNSERGVVPKSHLAKVIIRNNISARKMLTSKLNQISRMKIKTFYFNEYQKKKFVSELQNKSRNWEKEHEIFIRNLQLNERKSTNSATRPEEMMRATSSSRSQACKNYYGQRQQ